MKKNCQNAPSCSCKCELCKFKMHCITHEKKCHFSCGVRDWVGSRRDRG